MVAGDCSMTPKYSAEWWEKVAARTLEEVFQHNDVRGSKIVDAKAGRAREALAAEPEIAVSLTHTR